MKKIILFAAIALLFSGRAFAQNNWISFEIKGPGAGLRYERVINPRFTIGGYVSYTAITIPIFNYQTNSIEFGATVRWYPFARRFFTEMSLGLNTFEYTYYEERYVPSTYDGYSYSGGYYESYYEEKSGSGLCAAPGFGWTIDVGKMGGFFLSPGVKFPVTIGDQFNVTVAPYFAIGGAFK
jgi:hypothetical protein